MKTTTSKTVIDPHENFPQDIRTAFFKGAKDWELTNNSFVFWTVGDFQNTNDGFPEDQLRKIVDDYLLQYFEKGKSIIILYWW